VRHHAKVLLAVATAFMVFGASSALAATATLHPALSSFDGGGAPAGSMSPQAIVVDQASGDTYVIDSANNVVVKFDSSHEVDKSFGEEGALNGSATPSGSFAFSDGQTVANAIAIDESGTATDGNLYVADPGHGVIDVFDSSGTYLSRLTGSTIPSGPFGKPDGLAINSSGDLYIADAARNRIYRFNPAANPPLEADYASQSADPNLSSPAGLAIDSTGVFYVVNYRQGLARFDSGLAFQETVDSNPVTAVAVDPADDNLYSDDSGFLSHYDSAANANAPLASFAQNAFFESLGIALDSSANVYASDPILANVQVFGPAVEVETPSATIEAVTDITSESATFHGQVNPNGSGPESDTSYRFEVSLDGSYWVALNTAHSPISGTSDVAVEDEAPSGNRGFEGDINPADKDNEFGLLPGKHYHVRLVATNAASEPTGGPTVSGEVEFDTDPIAPGISPIVNTSDVTTTAATIHATVNPYGAPTTFHVEYGADTSYGQRAPLAEAEVGTGVKPLAVSQALSGLSPGTVYHYRVVATNSAGTTEGADHTLQTKAPPLEAPDTCPNAAIRAAQGAQNVSDCRAYEVVSPVLKNGADVIGNPELTRAASDGEAVQFSSFSGFADTPGSGLVLAYMGVRSPTGWQTHSLMPPQDAQNGFNATTSLVPAYQGFSEDLSKGVFRALTPLTDAPLVSHTRNLYLRENLRDAAAPTDRLLTATEVPLPPFGTHPNHRGYRPTFAAASADFGHVIFESRLSLTTGVNSTVGGLEKPKLYEWFDGKVRLAGVLPNGQPAKCPDEGEGEEACSSAGQGATDFAYTDTTISRDGSRIFFSSPVANQGGFTSETQLYMRLDGTSTVRVSASERTVGPAEPEQGAKFAAASADGRYVYFLDAERLTDDPIGADDAPDLYRYDTVLPESDPHNLTLLGRSAFGVLGVSENGDYVYFAANSGQGAVNEPAKPPEGHGLYVLHDGQLRVIGFVNEENVGANLSIGGYNLGDRQSRVTPDGQALIFTATEGDGLTGHDHGECVSGTADPGCRQAYVYDATASGGAGNLSCASCNPSGATATAPAAIDAAVGSANASRTSHLSHALSDDGKRVFFMTRERLLTEDRNGNVQDVYEYDVPSHTLHLITTGASPWDSHFVDASHSGDDVFFITRDRLARRDIDNAYDLYDARVDGGYSEPPSGPVCEGDSCLISPSAPNDPTPASSVFNGAGNTSPARRRCPKGSRRVRRESKVRCIKAKKKRAHHERRTGR
jgi:hypothetical protein